jgi:cullin 2
MSSLKPKEIDFNEQWSIVLGTVRSVISMGRFGHTDKATWQERFFGLTKKAQILFFINKLFISIDIYYVCVATPDSHAERLYEETKKFLEDHCKSMKKVFINKYDFLFKYQVFLIKDISESDQNMLGIYVKYWSEYKTGSDWLNILYAYGRKISKIRGIVFCLLDI